MKLFSRLYVLVMQWARHRYAPYYLAITAFIESVFWPIPVDVMLAPMALAKPHKAWHYATLATIFSVLGACVRLCARLCPVGAAGAAAGGLCGV